MQQPIPLSVLSSVLAAVHPCYSACPPLSKQGPPSNKLAAPRCALSRHLNAAAFVLLQSCSRAPVVLCVLAPRSATALTFAKHPAACSVKCLQSCSRAPVVLCAGAQICDSNVRQASISMSCQVFAVVFACACGAVCWRPDLGQALGQGRSRTIVQHVQQSVLDAGIACQSSLALSGKRATNWRMLAWTTQSSTSQLATKVSSTKSSVGGG